MSISQEIHVLAYYVIGQVSELKSSSLNPHMPFINVESWLSHLIHDCHLVAHYSFNQKLWILKMAGYCLGIMPDEFFRFKTYKRTIESVAQARKKVELHGQGWFYFGMTHFYGWKDMIELINKFLKSKSTERVWLEQMDDKLLAQCPKCNKSISYTSCVVKLKDFQHKITCQTCADHDR